VLRDVHAHLEKKQPSAKRVFALVGNFIEKGADLKDMLPLLLSCLEHDDGSHPLMGDAMPLLADVSKTSDPIQLAASMIKLMSKDKLNNACRPAMHKLAKTIYDKLPAVKTVGVRRVDDWASDTIMEFRPF